MKPLGDRMTHFWLASRMAKVTETDLVAAMEAAELTQEDWAGMITACRGCDWTDGCERWLDAQADDTVEAAPEGCENRVKFMKLKKALEALE